MKLLKDLKGNIGQFNVFFFFLSWFIVVKFYFKKSAENYHVREWATNKLVGAHDNFSAGYKHDITHLNILFFSFSHNECHLV